MMSRSVSMEGGTIMIGIRGPGDKKRSVGWVQEGRDRVKGRRAARRRGVQASAHRPDGNDQASDHADSSRQWQLGLDEVMPSSSPKIGN